MKILGIGLPRTGTYSLAKAFCILGYFTKHYPERIEDILLYDACSEVRFDPADLLKKYPGSTFIYTTRNMSEWLESCHKHVRHFRPNWNPFWNKPNEWPQIYEDRRKQVESLTNVLVIDICKGEGWERLCPFLGAEKPNQDFPFLNQSSSYAVPKKIYL